MKIPGADRTGGTERKILLPALHRGKERRCSRHLLRKSKFQHLRVACVRAASSTSWMTWGLAGTRGAPFSCERLDVPAKVSIRPGAEQLWRTQEGAHGDGQTEAWPRGQRWMVHHSGSPRSAAVPPRTAGQSPRRCRWTALPGRWDASRKRALSTSFISASLNHQPRVGTTLVHLFERLGLVNLQDSYGVQGGGCLASSAISFGRESSCQLTGLGRETRTVPPSGGVSWAQVHRDRSLHLGNARVPPGHSAVEGSEDGGGGRAASGRERGHPRLRQLLMHLREERHRGRARLWAAPRSEKPIVQPRGLRTGRSGDLQPDAHGCPGKHGRQLWVGCGGGDNTRGGQPHLPFILRGREPIPRCCDRHPIYRWRTEWNARCPVGQTSEITREPDRMFAAWGVRGLWGRARRRGSYCNPQISQSISQRSSARRETSTGGGRGCQSFQKERRDRNEIMLLRPQQAHESFTNASSACWKPRHWRQRSCLSSADRKRPQPEGHGRNGILKKTRSSVICSFRICSLSWSAQGNRWWEGLRWSHRYANQEQNKDERLCGDQHSSHPLGSEAKI